MDVNQIKEIISKGETQEVELKESFHSHQEVSKILCGLANTFGGLLFLGVKDNRDILGLKENLDKIQQEISAANQNIYPTPLISIEVHKIENKAIITVVIQRATDNVYHTFQGAIYVRMGSTTKRLDGQTQLEFLRNKQILSFDESYESMAKIEDVDKDKIHKYLTLREQEDFLKDHSIEDFLISSKLASRNGGFKIKNSAMLVFAKNPINFFPQIEVKLVQFAGKEPVDILSHKLIQEDLIRSIEESLAFIKSHIKKRIKITDSAKREEEYEYPISVIREAIVNAIAHRDYFSRDSVQISIFEDRLEITNPGSLPNALPKELFGTISVQRNPITYRFLRDMGYVEGLGTGISRMKNQMRKAGLNDPEFKFTESFFRIILSNKKGVRKPIYEIRDLNERQKKALEYLKKNKSLKAKTYSEINNVSYATSVNEINEMIHFNYIKKIGSYRGAYYILKKEGK
ncbi:MAG TPA: RNA-binding domain-containing protein [Candidatus Nanoarchaeia archaeon]|nr:RNA-binding domain-containing protein [Candidatus Nanoarchaeia archaeon]